MRAAILAIAAALVLPGLARAQTIDIQYDTIRNPAVHIGQDYVLHEGDAARQIVVIAGDATIDGHVDTDVVVILGKARLGPKAVIDGSFVVVGGNATVMEGAKVGEDAVVIGGLDAPATFSPGGQQVVIGTRGIGGAFQALGPWLTRGLLYGRPIVPDLGWIWTIALAFLLINLLINIVFDAPVRACATTLRDRPLSAFITGVLVVLLSAPICVLLAISVVGIVVIPFFWIAVLIATLIGKVGFARWLGMGVVHQNDLQHRGESMRSFAIGSAIMCVAYMIPLLGFITWALAGVFGLGSATQAFFRAYRRENPKPPKPVPVAPPAPVPAAIAVQAPIAMAAEPIAAPEPQAFVQPDVDLPLDPLPPVPPVSPIQPPPASNEAKLVALPRATFFERLVAFVIDFVVVSILADFFGFGHRYSPFSGNALLLFGVIYHVGFWTWRGTTLGGIAMQLRVVRADGLPLQFGEALVRGLTGIFSLLVAGLGFLWVIWDPERQAWHDRIAGTYVVKVPRHWPI